MKIFCIGRNYAEHAKELNNAVPTKPLIFMKPPTALLLENKPLFYPDFTKNLHHELEVVLRICKNGKAIQPEFAHRYYDKIALGIDFTARDVQDDLKSKGQPWELAKAFDNSAVLSEFVELKDFDAANIKFHMTKNGESPLHGHPRQPRNKLPSITSSTRESKSPRCRRQASPPSQPRSSPTSCPRLP